MAPAGGSSEWFMRPTNDTIKAAVVFAGDSESAMIKVLDGEQSFAGSLQNGIVERWMKETSSVFQMGS